MTTPTQPTAARAVDESGADLLTATQRGTVEGLLVSNTGASTAFLQVFFGPLAAVTVGTTEPAISVPVAAGSTIPVPLGNDVVGLSCAFTAGAADAAAPSGAASVIAYVED